MSDPDDFEAVRQIVDALAPFESSDQERIIRWACEKVGLDKSQFVQSRAFSSSVEQRSAAVVPLERPKDIRSFIDAKSPRSENQFAATVAYFFRFEVPTNEQKTSVSANDLNDAARQAGRSRLKNPGQTLLNAHGQGYFDKAERGQYSLNTVGENLVAMALPQAAGYPQSVSSVQKRQTTRKITKAATTKKR